MGWQQVLALNEQREVTGGSFDALAQAVRSGFPVKSYSTFDYAEHMGDPENDVGLVQEMMSFGVVYWLEGGHVAAIQNTRYPANASLGFGDQPSLSFFLNNATGHNSIARPFLDGRKGEPRATVDLSGKYRTIDEYDFDTCSPCENFTYDFGEYRWFVDNSWQEVLSADKNGNVLSGSLDALQNDMRAGKSIRVGVKNLCAELAPDPSAAIEHEVFIELHSIYNHHDSGFLGGESQPIIRVSPNVPMRYQHGNWNFGWVLPRTDGVVHQLVIDPLSRTFSKTEGRFASRWFVC